MPLIPVARRAVVDAASGAVHFVMKDGSRPVLIRVTASLEASERARTESERFAAFKLQRKRIERAANEKYSRRQVEADGSVVVGDADVARADGLCGRGSSVDLYDAREASVFEYLAKAHY
jgi:hypothetical protein